MNHKMKILYILFLCVFYIATMQAQEVVVATGGVATGSGGSVAYTIGQFAYHTYKGTNGTIDEGVQQPYEISVVTGIKDIPGINIQCTIYPNPTIGLINLIIESCDNGNLMYYLFDSNGILLENNKIMSEKTEIFISSMSSSVYFLKILNNNKEVKVFKIVKR